MAKERRTGLGLLDRLLWVVSLITVCGAGFVIGLYTGKSMQERRLGGEERVIRLPVTSTPPPEGQRPKTDSDLTFYDTLVPGDRGGRPVPATPPTTVPSAAAKPAPAAGPIVVPAPAKPVPAVPPAAKPSTVATTASPTAKPSASPPAHASAPPSGTPVSSTPPATHPAARPATPPVATAAVPKPEAPSAVPVTMPPPPAAATGGGWSVQANPTRSRDEADALARELHGKGYDAVVVRLPRDGDVWYRVRIGRYATSEQATEVMQRLRDREGVQHAFVAGGE